MIRYLISIFVLLAAIPMMAGENVVVVLDDSGSMSGGMGEMNKMEAAKQALFTVLNSLPDDAKVGILLLNGNGATKWVVPLGLVNKEELRRTLEWTGKNQLIRPNGGTPLGVAMKEGADRLLELKGKEHYGSYRLLIVSDGEATDRSLVESYLPDILSRGLTVDVIGVKMSSQHSLATKVHTYRSADNPDSLTTAVSEVFAESAGTDSDEDFALSAAFEDNDIAVAVLTALGESGNHPIGEKPVVALKLDADGNVVFDQNGNVVKEEGMGGGMIALIVFAVILVVIGVVAVGVCLSSD